MSGGGGGGATNAASSAQSSTKHTRKTAEEGVYDFFLVEQNYVRRSRDDIAKHLEELINRGGEINYKDKFENTALLLVAFQNQKIKRIKNNFLNAVFLLSVIDFQICKQENAHACQLFDLLVSKGACIETNSYGHSVLHNAAIANNVELAKSILNRVPSLSIQNPFIRSSFNDVFQIVVFACKDILEEQTNVENQTALHYAVKKGNKEMVACLIEAYGANKEAKDHQNRTPLFLAAEHGTCRTWTCAI